MGIPVINDWLRRLSIKNEKKKTRFEKYTNVNHIYTILVDQIRIYSTSWLNSQFKLGQSLSYRLAKIRQSGEWGWLLRDSGVFQDAKRSTVNKAPSVEISINLGCQPYSVYVTWNLNLVPFKESRFISGKQAGTWSTGLVLLQTHLHMNFHCFGM
jgi:hypothetical protein